LNTELTDRQQRELDYHREHAKQHKSILAAEFSWDVLNEPSRRWWNAYWAMYDHLLKCDLRQKSVLVVGCGFGDDALRLAKLGARVSAFDLSPDSLEIAAALAKREGLEISFEQMPAERMLYANGTFDVVLCRDILHHVDIPSTVKEIVRVSKPGATLVVNEIYSHSLTEGVRRSKFVEGFVYPKMRSLIYGPGKPYITEDERKLNERDLEEVMKPLQRVHFKKFFNFLVTRIVPDRFEGVAKLDHLALKALYPFGNLLAGRVLFAARIRESSGEGSQAV